MRSTFFILALLGATEAYRIHSQGKVEARGKATGKANFHRVEAMTKSNSTVFITAAATLGALSITQNAAVATIGTAVVASNCAPALATVTPTLLTGSAAAGPLAAILIPLLVLAVLALIGGLVAMAVAAQSAAMAMAFCPAADVVNNPTTALTSTGPYMAFPNDLEAALDGELEGGMPHCHSLKTVTLTNVECSKDDKECMEQACRSRCCEDARCTFYQYETQAFVDESGKVVCELGQKHQLVDKNCDKPFFGETCVSRSPLWEQTGADRTKCVSGYGVGEGFMVDDQLDCQNTAVENGHSYYQYNDDKKTCATCKDLGDLVKNSVDNWKVYGGGSGPSAGKMPVIGGGCTDWKFNPGLLSAMQDTKIVRPDGRGCRGNGAVCLKKRCRQVCDEDSTCKFYQFQEGENQCLLGSSSDIKANQMPKKHFGGFISSERSCKSGYQCPSTGKCVDECAGECPTFSLNGKMGGRGKTKGKWCLRNEVEGMCFDGNWDDTYQGVDVGEWCIGMDKEAIKLDPSEPIRDDITGEDVCKRACCSKADCAVYQVSQVNAKLAGDDLTQSGGVQCYFGLENAAGRPKFKCSGKKLKKWRKADSPVGKAIAKRGCTDGSIACLQTGKCVDHCRSECLGAEIHNNEKGVCESLSTPEEENFAFQSNHKLAQKDNIMHAMPRISSKLMDDSYYLNPMEVTEDEFLKDFTTKEAVMDIQTHSRKIAVASNGVDMSGACDSLKDSEDGDYLLCWQDGDSCTCEFNSAEQANCANWFADEGQMKHVLDDAGMMIFTGDKCKCDKVDGAYQCTFGMQKELPKIRPSKNSEATLELKSAKAECNSPPTNMGTCKTVRFGDHACGYSCEMGDEEVWCNDKGVCGSDSDLSGKSNTCAGYDCRKADFLGDVFVCDKDGMTSICDQNCNCN